MMLLRQFETLTHIDDCVFENVDADSVDKDRCLGASPGRIGVFKAPTLSLLVQHKTWIVIAFIKIL